MEARFAAFLVIKDKTKDEFNIFNVKVWMGLSDTQTIIRIEYQSRNKLGRLKTWIEHMKLGDFKPYYHLSKERNQNLADRWG